MSFFNKNYFSDNYNSFIRNNPTTARSIDGAKTFLGANTLVSKVVFLILILLLFIFLFRMGSSLLAMLFMPSRNPKLVKGMKSGKKIKVIPQNPNIKNSIPVMRSNNERGGLEFTWTVWLFIESLEYKRGERKHIFHKGSQHLSSGKNVEPSFVGPAAYPNNGPGLYLHPTRNSLIIVMNTFEKIMEEVEINDVPLHKWVNVGIRVKGEIMDVYVNGQLALRHIFKSVPKQNYGNVFVNMNGGFDGEMSDLWYHDRALTGTQIMDIVRQGPDLTRDDTMVVFPPYFSLKWFFENNEAPAKGSPNWPLDSANNTGL